MNTTHDVIICGGGLAGSAAGLSLARRGHTVAIVDRARFPRKKLCGGLLTWKSVRLLEAHFNETVESLTQAGAIDFVSDRYAIRSFENTLAQGHLPFPFHLVDRTVFDDLLLKRAAEAGADIIQEAPVTQCSPETGTVTCDGGLELRGHHIIGADGANSKVRASFPNIDRQRMRRFMAPTIEIKIPRSDFPREVEYPELYVGCLKAGYGWVFPNRDRIVLGICGLKDEEVKFSQLFKTYLEFLEIDPDTISGLHGHPLPYGNYLADPVYETALLAGDAGGFVEPLFGEGIFFALCTGMYAGDAIAQGLETGSRPGPIYTRRLHQYIMPELTASDRLRWTLFKGMRLAGPRGLGWFVNALSTPLAEMVHGMRSYEWLKRKQWDF